MSSTLLKARATIFLVTNTFAAVALGFALCLLFQSYFHPRYIAPTLVTAFLHLVSITTMALTSRVLHEVVWLSLLCAMWLVDGILNRNVFRYWGYSTLTPLQVITTFCFLNSILLLGYIIALVVVAVKAGQAGRSIWSSNVKEIGKVQGPANHGGGNINPPNATVAIHPLVNNYHYNAPPATPQFQPYQQQHGQWSQA